MRTKKQVEELRNKAHDRFKGYDKESTYSGIEFASYWAGYADALDAVLGAKTRLDEV